MCNLFGLAAKSRLVSQHNVPAQTCLLVADAINDATQKRFGQTDGRLACGLLCLKGLPCECMERDFQSLQLRLVAMVESLPPRNRGPRWSDLANAANKIRKPVVTIYSTKLHATSNPLTEFVPTKSMIEHAFHGRWQSG